MRSKLLNLMHTSKLVLSVILISLMGMFFASCENEVDLNADYKEITIVYGLLNQAQDRQYVKITKAFQTEGDVFVAAKDPKNSIYDPKDLEVWLDEYDNDVFLKTIYLDSVMINNKDTGDFYSPNEIIYATPLGVKFNEDYNYHLSIKVKSTGNTIESRTKMIHDFTIIKPISLQTQASFVGNFKQTVSWNVAKNGVLHQFVIRYFYTDVPQSGSTSSHYVDLVFPTKRADPNALNEKMVIEFYGSSFYQNLEAKISLPEAGMKRYSDSLYYMFNVADEDFTIYLDINGPSNSVVQERPAYSNVTNGVGLFSSRFFKTRYFSSLNIKSLNELYSGQYTYKLGFVDRP